jgi:hypothetical protein
MNQFKKSILPILLAMIWISVSEFVRNQFLFQSLWVDHYKALGLVFPAAPVNGAMWGVWALVYAVTIYAIVRKYTLVEAWLLSWVFGFVLMWLVIGNLGVLPFGLLYAAVPLSLLESFVACFIIKKMS